MCQLNIYLICSKNIGYYFCGYVIEFYYDVLNNVVVFIYVDMKI